MLGEFGLTKTEEKVYLTLLKLGESSAAEIIKKTQLHRTTVYDVLERLIEKGLASSIVKDKVKHYSPVNPSKFLEIATEEKTRAEKKQELAKKIIQDIGVMQKGAKTKSIAQVFVGEKGQRTIMSDIIETGEDFLIFGSEGSTRETLPIYVEQWAAARRKKNIKAKIIATQGTKPPIWELNEIRFVSKEYQSPATTMIYGDKVAMFIDEEPFLIIVIENKKLAQSYRNYFKLVWGVAEKD
ncbi:MAG: helix-turn-helix domain-containing protein [archaeon]